MRACPARPPKACPTHSCARAHPACARRLSHRCCKKRSPKAYAAVQRRVSKLTESTVEISVPSMSFKGVGEESAHVAPPPPMGDAPTPPPPPNDEIQDEIESRLEKLKSLTMRNLITEEEYSAKKAEVLKDMKI